MKRVKKIFSNFFFARTINCIEISTEAKDQITEIEQIPDFDT